MSKIIQSTTFRIETGGEAALEEMKRIKKLMEGKGVGVRAFWAIEAGAESGTATVAYEFPNAVAWGKLVDSQDPELVELRRRGAESNVMVSTALVQEIDLS
ncbi:MAG: hypothetical protein ACLQRH_13895 [Acidimicrobiales bacterium]